LHLIRPLFRSTRRSTSSGRPRRTLRPALEQLEDRLTPAAGLREQYMLELVNRMRMNPATELPRLLNSGDPDIASALASFNVDKNVLAQQWATLTPAAPLAWNDTLANVALTHSQGMLQFDQQTHTLPGEQPLDTRLANAGFLTPLPNVAWSYNTGENIAAFAKNVFQGHASLAIDWASGPSGMRSPPEHRINLMNPQFQEIGIGMVDATAGKQTGPLLITQDFSFRSWLGRPFLLGVVYKDTNADGLYGMGEGLGGASVNVSGAGGTFTTTTTAAGGYQLQLPAGTYTVTVSGAGLASPLTQTVTIGSANVEASFVAPTGAVAPATPTMTGPTSATTVRLPGFTWTASSGAVRYDL
jgi:uncharacterized protein YkwD